MIVWKGRGIFSILVLLLSFIVCVNLVPEEFSDYGFVISFFVAAIFSWIFGNLWNKNNERTIIDEKTGKRLILKSSHELFWIPLQFWGIIFFVFGLIILFQKSFILGIISSVVLLIMIIIQFKDKLNFSSFENNENENKIKIKKELPKTIVSEKVEEIKPIIGNEKSVNEMSEEELNDYYKKYMPK